MAVLAVALGACGGGATTAPGPTGARPRSTGSIEILEPAPGAALQDRDIVVRVKVTGARVLAKLTTDPIRPDVGHIHVLMDGKTLTVLAGETYTIEDAPQGRHLIRAEFVATDHLSFTPPVLAAVTVTVT